MARPSNASRANRPTRTPVSGRRNILTVDGKDDAYEYRWVNDVDNRISAFKEGGWEIETNDVIVGDNTADSSDGVDSLVSKNVGQGTISYLMKIKKDWYKEDQDNKQAEVNKSEEAMKRDLNSGTEGRYGSVKIT